MTKTNPSTPLILDPTDAPESYKAVKSLGCSGCAFCDGEEGCVAPEDIPSCGEFVRKDGVSVIFVAIDSAPATLLHPMGSCGESVCES